MDLRSNPFEEGGNDAPRFEHRPAWIMDTAQGGDLVSQLDPSEVLPSYRAEHTDRVIPSVHSVHTDHILPSERDDQTFRTIPSDHPDRTARAVHRIDPHTSRIELSLEPRPRDGIDRSTSLLSRPSRQDKTDGRAIIHLGHEESKDGRRFSLIALFVRPACPEGCTDVLTSVFDLLMDFSLRYITKEGVSSCPKTCLTTVHILVKRIIQKFSLFVWNVWRVCGSSRVCRYPSHHGPTRPELTWTVA